MPKKTKAFKVGDTVYVRTPYLKIIKAVVKEIHDTDFLPYELDLKTKCRFYDEADMFNTYEECVAHAKEERVNSIEDMIQNKTRACAENDLTPTEDGQWITTTGEKISADFSLSAEDLKELDELVGKVQLFCMKRYIPFCILVGESRKGMEITAHRCAYFPGPRTFMFIRAAWEAAQACISWVAGEPPKHDKDDMEI